MRDVEFRVISAHVVQATLQLPERRGGGTMRQFELLRSLAQKFTVTVIAAEGDHYPPTAVAELARFAEVVLVPVPNWPRDVGHRALRLARIAASDRPYAASRYEPLDGPVREALCKLDRRPDVLYVEPSNTAHWREFAPPGVRTIVGFHDLIHEVERERAKMERSPARRLLSAVEWRKAAAYERAQAAAADLCVMASSREAERLMGSAPAAKTVVVPNGVDTSYFAPSVEGAEDDREIVFSGSMNHPPNEDGAVRLVRDLLPRVRAFHPDVRLTIVGRAPTPRVRALGRTDGVDVVGEVADVRPYLRRAAVAVAPLTFGGGSRLKILEALALGRAMVSTPKGAEGLDLVDAKHLLVRSLDDFPEAITSLLSEPERRGRLGAAGRALVEAEYDWRSIGERLTESVDALLRDHR